MIGAVGQAEREAMLERQREGIAKAKREGRYKGRVPTARRQAAEIIRLKEAGVRPSEIAVRLGIGRASVYRVLGEQEMIGWRRELCPQPKSVQTQPLATLARLVEIKRLEPKMEDLGDAALRRKTGELRWLTAVNRHRSISHRYPVLI